MANLLNKDGMIYSRIKNRLCFETVLLSFDSALISDVVHENSSIFSPHPEKIGRTRFYD